MGDLDNSIAVLEASPEHIFRIRPHGGPAGYWYRIEEKVWWGWRLVVPYLDTYEIAQEEVRRMNGAYAVFPQATKGKINEQE